MQQRNRHFETHPLERKKAAGEQKKARRNHATCIFEYASKYLRIPDFETHSLNKRRKGTKKARRNKATGILRRTPWKKRSKGTKKSKTQQVHRHFRRCLYILKSKFKWEKSKTQQRNRHFETNPLEQKEARERKKARHNNSF